MQAKQIKPGTIYAYDENPEYQYLGGVHQIVFFEKPDSKTSLYQVAKRQNAFRLMPNSNGYYRPRRGQEYFDSDRGYIAAIGSDISGASLNEALETGRQFGLNDYRKYYYSLVTSLRHVHGPDYGQYVAEKQKRVDTLTQQREKERQEKRDRRNEYQRLQERLSVYGIHVSIEPGSPGSFHATVGLADLKEIAAEFESRNS